MPTYPVSTVPAVKAYLFTQFTAAALTVPAPFGDTAQLVVMYGPPAQYQPDDIVAFGTVRRTITEHGLVGSGGAGALSEDYHVEVIIDVFRGSDLAQQVEERAYLILAAVIETPVRVDPTLGGLVQVAWPAASDANSTWDPDNLGRHTEIRAEIHCSVVI